MKDAIINSVIRDMVNKDDTPQAILNKTVRFSISLTNLQNKRLEILTKKLGVSKQEFIAKVLDAALLELEHQLKLIDEIRTDALGLKSYSYNTRYVKEIVESMGIKEEDWWEMVNDSV